jgi:hypothetical protein
MRPCLRENSQVMILKNVIRLPQFIYNDTLFPHTEIEYEVSFRTYNSQNFIIKSLNSCLGNESKQVSLTIHVWLNVRPPSCIVHAANAPPYFSYRRDLLLLHALAQYVAMVARVGPHPSPEDCHKASRDKSNCYNSPSPIQHPHPGDLAVGRAGSSPTTVTRPMDPLAPPRNFCHGCTLRRG